MARSGFIEGFTAMEAVHKREAEEERQKKADARAEKAEERAQTSHEQSTKVNAMNIARMEKEEARRVKDEEVEKAVAKYYTDNTKLDPETGAVLSSPKMSDATRFRRDAQLSAGLFKEAEGTHKAWREMWRGELDDKKEERSSMIDEAVVAMRSGNGKLMAEAYNKLYPNGHNVTDVITGKDGKVYFVEEDGTQKPTGRTSDDFLKTIASMKSSEAMLSRMDTDFSQKIAKQNADSSRISANASATTARATADNAKDVRNARTALGDALKKGDANAAIGALATLDADKAVTLGFGSKVRESDGVTDKTKETAPLLKTTPGATTPPIATSAAEALKAKNEAKNKRPTAAVPAAPAAPAPAAAATFDPASVPVPVPQVLGQQREPTAEEIAAAEQAAVAEQRAKDEARRRNQPWGALGMAVQAQQQR
jgi:hypothetical protein